MAQYLKKLLAAFRVWKYNVMTDDIINLLEKNEQNMGENDALTEHINNLEEALEAKEEEVYEHKSKRFGRMLANVRQKEKAGALRNWARNALHEANIDIMGNKIGDKMNEIFKRHGFKAIQQAAHKNLRSERQDNRLSSIVLTKMRGLLATTFDAW